MNKASGKLAAGVRKVKIQQKAPAAMETPAAERAPEPAPPKNAPAAPHTAADLLHPARVWPD